MIQRALLLSLMVFLTGCATTSGPSPSVNSPTAPTATVSVPATTAPSKSSALRTTAAQTEGCETSDPKVVMTRDQRKAVINTAVADAEKEITSPDAFNDNAKRMQIGTFAAGSVSDSTPFISVDRDCWAYFYDAQTALNAGDEAEAKKAGDEWRVCLVANFPSRLEFVQPYFSCFKK